MKATMGSELEQAVGMLIKHGQQELENRQMPGDGRYQPADLIPFFGYDQWARWCIIVEWFWMKTLAQLGVMSEEDAALLTSDVLGKMLAGITTTQQDAVEKKTGHDILALLALMRVYLPGPLHRWLHYCATSYDIINTAYALQLKSTFSMVFMPKLRELDELWRKAILENKDVLQAGRTHLQTALPVTVGFWLAGLHSRFMDCAVRMRDLSGRLCGKFSGAVGTSASQRVLISAGGEKCIMRMLDLSMAEVSTQITPPESMARFYFELVLLSGTLANLGEDVRILQSSQFGELGSVSSTSSAMSHKTANPIAAENLSGMHVSVLAEFSKVSMTLVSDLQRDLRWSNVMRSQAAIAVYAYQQLLTAVRLFKSLSTNVEVCTRNFNQSGKLVVAELLHLSLQAADVPEAHHFVNKQIVPLANETGSDLVDAMESYLIQNNDPVVCKAWEGVFWEVRQMLRRPEWYIGDAILVAESEAKNILF